MQTAKFTLMLKVPVSIVTPLPQKQVVVIANQHYKHKSPLMLNSLLSLASASSNKTQDAKVAKKQIKAEKAKPLAEAQKETV